jgi:hypothetical protein
VVSYLAINKVLKYCQQYNLLAKPDIVLSPYTEVFITTIRLPYVYIIRDRIKANSILLLKNFYTYWRLDRLATLIPLDSALFLRDFVRIKARGKNKKNV